MIIGEKRITAIVVVVYYRGTLFGFIRGSFLSCIDPDFLICYCGMEFTGYSETFITLDR